MTTTFDKMKHFLSLPDVMSVEFDHSVYDEIIKFCFESATSRRVSEKDLAFLHKRIMKYVVNGFISTDDFKFFINYLDNLRIMIYYLGGFYEEQNVSQISTESSTESSTEYLLNHLHFSAVDANDLLTKKGLPLHHFCLRVSQSQIGNLAVTYVKEENDEKVVADVLIEFVNKPGVIGWAIKEEGKDQPEIYPTVVELINKCKVFKFFCFENNDVPRESLL